MRAYLAAILALLVAFMAACSGNADAAAGQAWWQAVLSIVLDVAIAIAVPVLCVLGYIISKKWGVDLERKDIDWVVKSSVGFGEQQAKKALKDGQPLEGNAVLAEALKHGEDLLNKTGLASKWGDKLADLIEAKLGESEVEKDYTEPKTVEAILAAEAEEE
jgi:hypothetical protein